MPTIPDPNCEGGDLFMQRRSGVALDADGRLAVDHPCACCGYNLRGLVPSGACPECGLAVEDSLRRDTLRFADRRWLRTVRLGLLMAAVSCTTMLGSAGLLVVLFLPNPATYEDTFSSIIAFLFFVTVIVGLVAIPAALVGVVLFTTKDPAEKCPCSGRSLRCWTRGLAIAALALTALTVILVWNPLLPSVLRYEVSPFGWVGASILVWPLAALVSMLLPRFQERAGLAPNGSAPIVVGAVLLGVVLAIVTPVAPCLLGGEMFGPMLPCIVLFGLMPLTGVLVTVILWQTLRCVSLAIRFGRDPDATA